MISIRYNFLIAVSLLLTLIFGCQNKDMKQPDIKTENIKNADSVENKVNIKDTVFFLSDRRHLVKIQIITPTVKPIATLIILHGWKLPPMELCDKTSICKKALERGYILIIPDMGKSIYSSKFFKETRKDWQIYPDFNFFTDSIIGFIHKRFSLLLPGQNSFIYGISTGGKGAIITALNLPKIFKGAASLSGDYDQTKIPNDKIYAGFYGPISKYYERWKNFDNIVTRIKEFNVPVYIGHGRLDNIVPVSQSIEFYDSLTKYNPGLIKTLHIDKTASHNYTYWGSEVENILNFFDRLIDK